MAKLLPSPPTEMAKNRQEIERKCSLFFGYHGKADLVAEKLDFLKTSKHLDFSNELLKYMIT